MSENNIPSEVLKMIEQEADKYGFQVPFDGTNKFYNDDLVKGFMDGATYAYKTFAEPLVKRIEELESGLKQIDYLKINISEAKLIATKLLSHE